MIINKTYKNDDLTDKKLDRKLVGEYEEWEVRDLGNKYDISSKIVIDEIRKFGPSRQAVEKYLKDRYGR